MDKRSNKKKKIETFNNEMIHVANSLLDSEPVNDDPSVPGYYFPEKIHFLDEIAVLPNKPIEREYGSGERALNKFKELGRWSANRRRNQLNGKSNESIEDLLRRLWGTMDWDLDSLAEEALAKQHSNPKKWSDEGIEKKYSSEVLDRVHELEKLKQENPESYRQFVKTVHDYDFGQNTKDFLLDLLLLPGMGPFDTLFDMGINLPKYGAKATVKVLPKVVTKANKFLAKTLPKINKVLPKAYKFSPRVMGKTINGKLIPRIGDNVYRNINTIGDFANLGWHAGLTAKGIYDFIRDPSVKTGMGLAFLGTPAAMDAYSLRYYNLANKEINEILPKIYDAAHEINVLDLNYGDSSIPSILNLKNLLENYKFRTGGAREALSEGFKRIIKRIDNLPAFLKEQPSLINSDNLISPLTPKIKDMLSYNQNLEVSEIHRYYDFLETLNAYNHPHLRKPTDTNESLLEELGKYPEFFKSKKQLNIFNELIKTHHSKVGVPNLPIKVEDWNKLIKRYPGLAAKDTFVKDGYVLIYPNNDLLPHAIDVTTPIFGGEGIYTGTITDGAVPLEYVDVINNNIEYIRKLLAENGIPIKFIGSSINVAKAGLVRDVHDYDTMAGLSKVIKRFGKDIKNGNKKVIKSVSYDKKGNIRTIKIDLNELGGKNLGDKNIIDLNVVSPDNDMGLELLEEFHPEVAAANRLRALRNQSPTRLSEDELMDFDENIKSIVDQIITDPTKENKGKNWNRPLIQLMYGDAKMMDAAIELVRKRIMGQYYYPVSLPNIDFSDVTANEAFLKKNDLTFFKDIAKDPERMKALVKWWYMDHTTFNRGVRDVGDMKNLDEYTLLWNMFKNGGSAMGVGLNTVRGTVSTQYGLGPNGLLAYLFLREPITGNTLVELLNNINWATGKDLKMAFPEFNINEPIELGSFIRDYYRGGRLLGSTEDLGTFLNFLNTNKIYFVLTGENFAIDAPFAASTGVLGKTDLNNYSIVYNPMNGYDGLPSLQRRVNYIIEVNSPKPITVSTSPRISKYVPITIPDKLTKWDLLLNAKEVNDLLNYYETFKKANLAGIGIGAIAGGISKLFTPTIYYTTNPLPQLRYDTEPIENLWYDPAYDDVYILGMLLGRINSNSFEDDAGLLFFKDNQDKVSNYTKAYNTDIDNNITDDNIDE